MLCIGRLLRHAVAVRGAVHPAAARLVSIPTISARLTGVSELVLVGFVVRARVVRVAVGIAELVVAALRLLLLLLRLLLLMSGCLLHRVLALLSSQTSLLLLLLTGDRWVRSVVA